MVRKIIQHQMFKVYIYFKASYMVFVASGVTFYLLIVSYLIAETFYSTLMAHFIHSKSVWCILPPTRERTRERSYR